MLPGIDVSHHKGKINWQEVAQAGIQFSITKATEGTTFVDHRLARNWEGIKAVGLIRGVFHYFRAQQNAHLQADHFLAQMHFEPGDLPPALDVEPINNKGATREQWITGVRIWLDRVEQATGRKPIIYTRANFWNSKLTPDFGDYPLWVAHYEVPAPTIPNGWNTWTFWQHTDKGQVAGVSSDVDRNHFNGTLDQLRALTFR